MSVTIRLSRTGRKNQPTYKLVVSNTRDKRNGKYVEVLGYYNPFDPEKKFSYDKEKLEKWRKHGAFVTNAVEKLLINKYDYVKYDPKKATKKDEDKSQESPIKDTGTEEKKDDKTADEAVKEQAEEEEPEITQDKGE